MGDEAENETRTRSQAKAFYVNELPVKNRVTKTCLDTNNAKKKQLNNKTKTIK